MASSEAPYPTLELNAEEREVLRQCRRNSIFRGLPLGTISVLVMRLAIKSGNFPHIKRFSSLYYPSIFTLGLLSGIASYRKPCMDKIMRLENSQLADQVRSFYKKAGMTDQIIGQQSSEGFQSETGAREGFYHCTLNGKGMVTFQGGAGNYIRDETQTYPSRDEREIGKSFSMPSPLDIEDDDTKQSSSYTSYEELRRRNRNQWMQASQRQPVQQPKNIKEEPPALIKDADDYHSSVDTYQSDIPMSSEGSTHEYQDDNNSRRGQSGVRKGPAPMKNIYGDVLEK